MNPFVNPFSTQFGQLTFKRPPFEAALCGPRSLGRMTLSTILERIHANKQHDVFTWTVCRPRTASRAYAAPSRTAALSSGNYLEPRCCSSASRRPCTLHLRRHRPAKPQRSLTFSLLRRHVYRSLHYQKCLELLANRRFAPWLFGHPHAAPLRSSPPLFRVANGALSPVNRRSPLRKPLVTQPPRLGASVRGNLRCLVDGIESDPRAADRSTAFWFPPTLRRIVSNGSGTTKYHALNSTESSPSPDVSNGSKLPPMPAEMPSPS